MAKRSNKGLAAIAAMPPEELRALVREQITNPHAHTILHDDPTDERPEDMVVELLRFSALSSEKRARVVTVLREIAGDIFNFLQNSNKNDPTARDETSSVVLDRWTSVMDRSAPEELKGTCKSLLQLALDTDSIPSDWQNAIARSALSFRLTQADEELWTQLLENKTLAPLAYNALLKINPKDEKRVYQLFNLWLKELYHKWPINTEFLTALTIQSQGNEKFANTFSRLRFENLALYDQILKCLKASRIRGLRNLFKILSKQHHLGAYQSILNNSLLTSELQQLLGEFFDAQSTTTKKSLRRKIIYKAGLLQNPNSNYKVYPPIITQFIGIESQKPIHLAGMSIFKKTSYSVMSRHKSNTPRESVDMINKQSKLHPQQQRAGQEPILVNF